MADEGALLKRVYGKLSNPVAPDGSMRELIPFNKKDKIGEYYQVPIRLGLELGVTRNKDHSAFALRPVRNGRYETALVPGSEILNRAQLSYGNMARLSDAKGDSRKAYDQDLAIKIASMVQGAELECEADIVYGAGGAAAIAADIGVVAAVGTVTSGTLQISITRASFIKGLWQDALGAALDFYDTTGATKINTNAPVVLEGTGRIDEGIILVSGNATDLAAIAANQRIVFETAATKSMLGVAPILSGVTSYFGIATAGYAQLKGVVYPVGGALSFDDFAIVMGRLADNGLNQGGTLMVGNQGWTSLLNDEVALRRHFGNDSIREINVGAKKLVFHTQNGDVTIRGYRYLKQSHALFLAKDEWTRPGAQDISPTVPGNPDEWFFQQMDSAAGAEIRCYGDQAVFSPIPFHSAIFTGIASSGDVLPGTI